MWRGQFLGEGVRFSNYTKGRDNLKITVIVSKVGEQKTAKKYVFKTKILGTIICNINYHRRCNDKIS